MIPIAGIHREGAEDTKHTKKKSLCLRVLVVGFLLFLLLAGCDGGGPAVVTLVATLTPDSASTPTPIVVSTETPTSTPSPTPLPPIKQLTDGGCCVQPMWSPDSKQVWFVDKPSPDLPAGVYAASIDAPLAEPMRVFDIIGVYSNDLSLVAYPDGRDTLVARTDNSEYWVMPNQGHSVVFSPDSQHVAWEIEEIDGPYDRRRTDIYLARFTGEDSVRAATVYGGGLVGWLDAQRILFSGRPSLDVQDRTLTTLSVTTNVAVDLVTSERISGVTASPGGAWIAYFISFNEDDSRNGIWVQRADGSSARKLDFWGAYEWRDDSRLLYIPLRASPDEPFVIWEYDTATGESRPVTDPQAAPIRIADGDWQASPDGRYVVYVNSLDRNLWLVELEP